MPLRRVLESLVYREEIPDGTVPLGKLLPTLEENSKAETGGPEPAGLSAESGWRGLRRSRW